MTTPAHVLKVLAAACDPDLPDPMPWPHMTQLGEGADGTILATGPTLSLQFAPGDESAVRRWAVLCGLQPPAVDDGPGPRHYVATSSPDWWSPAHAPGWAGCRRIDVYCVGGAS